MKFIYKYTDDMLLVIGIVLLCIGVFRIYVPAGFITTGICFIAFAYFYARNKVGDGG